MWSWLHKKRLGEINPSTPTQVCAWGIYRQLSKHTEICQCCCSRERSVVDPADGSRHRVGLCRCIFTSLYCEQIRSLRFSTNSLSIITPMRTRTINSSPKWGAPKDDCYGHAPTFNSRNNISSSSNNNNKRYVNVQDNGQDKFWWAKGRRHQIFVVSVLPRK